MEMLLGNKIRFPKLGIDFGNVPIGFEIFGVEIALYGITIGIGMILGLIIAEIMAKKTGQDTELYLDFSLVAIIFSVICARIYYVIFAFDEFKDNPLQIFNLRSGGLAIYGGIIGAVVIAIIFTKIKKYSFWLLQTLHVLVLLPGR